MASARRQLLLSVAPMTLLCLGGVALMGHVGRCARVTGEVRAVEHARLRVVPDAAALYAAWKHSGLRGRRVVHASQFLHFVPAVEAINFTRLDRFPIATFDLLARYEQGVGDRDVLWVAMQAGVAREVLHLVPSDVLQEKLRRVGEGAPGVTVGQRWIETTEHGSPRMITDRVPRIDEPVLLSVDASYFQREEPRRLLHRIRRAGLTADLVVLCRAEDNTAVSPAARARLDQLASALRSRAR